MKIYQIILDGNEGFTTTEEEKMREKVEWYRDEYPEKEADYEEIEVEKSEMGLCFNFLEMVPEWQNQCSAGIVRVMRSGTRDGIDDDGTCNSCPKFIPYEKLREMKNEQYSGGLF